MVKNSLGLIEVVGLAAALEAADAAVKAANIELIGYELTKGGGLVLVKICGDVGAVKAGVEAGKTAASKVNKVWSTHVIPRPHQQISCILESEETCGVKKEPLPIAVLESQVIENENEVLEQAVEIQLAAETDSQIEEEPDLQMEQEHQSEETAEASLDENIVKEQPEKQQADLCNLCNDPACHRKKGDPKITCIYYGKNN